jgi:ABC-type nitrate/sulfonate/bicarbonate transport system substrate-binding protein
MWTLRSIHARRSTGVLAGLLLAMLTSTAACGGAPAAKPSPPKSAPSPGQTQGAQGTPVKPPVAALTPVRFADCCDGTGGLMPVWVGIDKGFFARQGIRVSDTEMKYPASLDALVSGAADISNAPGTAIAAYASGQHQLEFVSGTYNVPVYEIYAKPGISSPNDLRGKTIAVTTRYSAPDNALEWFLEQKYGLVATRDYKLAFFSNIVDVAHALTHGLADAAILSTPADTIAQKAHFRMLADLKGATQQANAWIITTKSYATGHSQQVAAFVRGYVEAMGYIRDAANESAVLPIIEKWTHNSDPAVAQLTYRRYADVFTPVMDPQAMVPYIKLTNNPAVKGLSPSVMIDNAFVDQMRSDGFLKRYGFR